jgi:hypothetical protein
MKFAGEIFFTAPQVIDAGSTISIRVAGQASTNDWVEAFNHWHYIVTVTLQNGMSASKKILVNDIVLENNYVKEFDETFNFPVLMPNYDITAEILIRCYVGQVSYYEDVVEEEILIKTRGNSGGGGGNGGGGGESETDLKKYLIPAAVGAGALILLAIAIGGKK